MLSSIAEVNALKSGFKAAGINYTAPEPLPPFPQPTTTAADVAQAILSSKKSNPYSDPAVQTALAEYNVSMLGAITASQAALRDQHTVAHARAQLPGILEQIEAQFTETAEALMEAHNTLGNVRDLSVINLNTATPALAETVLKATRATATMTALIMVWRRVHRLHTGQTCTNAAEVYLSGNPDVALLLQYRKQQQQFTIWDQVLDGVEFSLATPQEAQKRYDQAINAHDNKKGKHVNYLTGKLHD